MKNNFKILNITLDITAQYNLDIYIKAQHEKYCKINWK